MLQEISLSILATIFFIFLFKTLRNPSESKNPPPSPPSFPIIGNLHQLGSQPHRALRALSLRHGNDLMLLRLGSVPVLVVSSPRAAREIMKTHDLAFADRPRAISSEKLLYNYRDIASAPYGEYWRQAKGISVLHLLSTKRVRSFRCVREEETGLLVEKIRRSCDSAVNLSELFVVLTNDITCRVALGRKYADKNEKVRKFKVLLREFTELLGGFDVGDYIPMLSWLRRVNGLTARMDKVAKEFDEFLEGVVEEHMERVSDDDTKLNKDGDEGDQYKNFVDILLWVQRENLLGFPIDRTCIKALILDMFAAGTDTTYAVLEWAMAELLTHPNAMKRLQTEVRTIIGPKANITEEDQENMPYLKAVLKETLRLHPPIPLLAPRVAKHDVNMMGYDVMSGCQVIVNAWAIGRDPSVWAHEPEEFRPDRFLNTGVDYKGRDFGLIPFGSGRRGCPGIGFAMAVNELALASLALKFDWSTLGSGLDMTETTGLTTHMKFPLMALAKLAR